VIKIHPIGIEELFLDIRISILFFQQIQEGVLEGKSAQILDQILLSRAKSIEIEELESFNGFVFDCLLTSFGIISHGYILND
jgi:hypothetical protein